MPAPVEQLIAQLAPNEQQVVRVAVARGYLTPERLAQAVARRAPGASLLPILGQGLIAPAHLAELRSIYQQATQHGGRASGGGHTVADGQGTVLTPSGRYPGPPAGGQTVEDGTATAYTPMPGGGPPPGGDDGLNATSYGPYEVERELARGGMGVVYIAHHRELNRRCALKVQLMEDPELAERFEIEAQAAAGLSHPNIVGIYDVGRVGARSYMALQLIEGRSLKDVVDEDGPLEPKDAARILAPIVRAMEFAHSRSILHRDLKPHNILLDEDEQPFLTDFGIAKDTSKAAKEGLTVEGQLIGTPAYMPPEQAEGNLGAIDRRSDVYSLGATLYHMLTGVPPFEGANTTNIIVQVLSKDAVPPSKRVDGIDLDIETICLKCLEKEPDERYDSATHLAEDLERYAAGDPIEARPVGKVERLLRKARKNTAALAGGALGALTLIVVLSGLSAWAISSRAEAVKQRKAAIKANDALVEARKKAEANAYAARESEAVAVAASEEAEQRRQEAEQAKAEAVREKAAAEDARDDARAAELKTRVSVLLERGYGLLALGRYRPAAQAFGDAAVTVGEADVTPEVAARTRATAARGAAEAISRVGYLKTLATGSWGHGAGVAFSPTGNLLATATDTVRLWDGRSLEPRAKILSFPRGQLGRGCRFSPDGQSLAVIAQSDQQTTILVLRIPSGDEAWRATLRGTQIQRGNAALAFSPEGDRLACVSRQAVQVYDVASGRALWPSPRKPTERRVVSNSPNPPFMTHPADSLSCAFVPDGRVIVVGYTDGMVMFWDANTGKQLGGINVQQTPNALAVTRPGSFGAQANLIVGTDGGSLLAYDVTTWAKRDLLTSGYGAVTCADVTPDERAVAVGFARGAGHAIDRAGRVLSQPLALGGEVVGCALSPRGEVWVTATGRHLVAWRLAASPWPGGRGIDAGGSYVAAGGAAAAPAFVWRLPPQPGSPLYDVRPVGSRQVLHHSLQVIRADGSRVPLTLQVPLIESSDDGRRLANNAWGYVRLRGMALSPDGRTLAAALSVPVKDFLARGAVELWSVGGGAPSRRGRVTFPQARSVAFAPDGRSFAVARSVLPGYGNTGPGRVHLFGTDGELRGALLFHLNEARGLAFSPQGDRLFTVGDDGAAAAWDLTDLSPDRPTVPTRAVLLGQGTPRQLGHDELARLALASSSLEDGPVRQATAASWKQLTGDGRTRSGWFVEQHGLRSCAASPSGEVALAGSDGSVRGWDPEAGRLSPPVDGHRGPIVGCAFVSDGHALATVGADGILRVWDVAAWSNPDAGPKPRVPLLRKVELPSGAAQVAFDPAGQACIVGLIDGQVLIVGLATPTLDGFDADPLAAIQRRLPSFSAR